MENKAYDRILKFAIRNEIVAQNFYRDVAAKLNVPHLKELFTALAAEEKKHQQTLERFQSGKSGTLQFDALPDYKIAETADKPVVSVKMKPADAFALAMKNEEEAMKLYTAMARVTSDAAQKGLLLELAAMEREHKRKMEDAFVNVAYPEVW